jgi:hypothetical protein
MDLGRIASRVANTLSAEDSEAISAVLADIAHAAEVAMDWTEDPMTGEPKNRTPWAQLQKAMGAFSDKGPIQAGSATVEVIGEVVDENMEGYNVHVVIKKDGTILYDGEFINDPVLDGIL